MTRKTKFLLRTAAMSILVGSVIPAMMRADGPRVKKQDPAIYFWYHFRSAVTANQFQKIESLTRFPFEMVSPDGPPVQLGKGAFREKIQGLLDHPAPDGRPMHELIQQKEDLTPEERATLANGEVTVGVFRFKTIKEKCYWVGSVSAPKPAAKPAASTVPPLSQEAETLVLRPDNSGYLSGAESASISRREEGAYREYVTDEQRRSRPESAPRNGPNYPVATLDADNLALAPPALQDPVKPQSPQETADPRTESVFRLYWVEFRQAALSNDFKTLRRLTRFPFELKGPLEDDKVKKYPAREFDLIWPRLLEADPKSWGPIRDSMRELIERREEPSVEEIAAEPSGEIQIGIFVFRKSKNRWRFTRAIIL